ncbi:hypothetical protein C7459_101260 [Tumebacillus permanentifrigoris]|uniref:Uncharacterized protein n=1 Tax=Tumebacillus permanentifrigoris TaxID=378543 RepID=A0A316DFA2_9BACL|nr:hypothetical protein C7459_101260 [Tumebacillus permanentifrigoris]
MVNEKVGARALNPELVVQLNRGVEQPYGSVAAR